MDSLNDNICRICFDQNVVLNWNDELQEFYGITYKDCYYKYTQLEMIGEDTYPQLLCQTCSTDLKTSHFLMEKALESYGILQRMYLNDSKIICIENEEIKEKPVLFTDQIFEPKCELDEFEMLIFKQNEEELIQEDNVGNEDKTLLEIETLNEATQQKRKRNACKNPKCKDNDTFDIPKSLINTSSAEEDINGNSKHAKKNKLFDKDDIDDQEFKKCKEKGPLKIKKKNEAMIQHEEKADDGSQEMDTSKEVPRTKKIYPKKKFMCSFCSKFCTDKIGLTRHEESHNEQRDRLAICPHCGMKLLNKLCLKIHLKTHKNNRIKNFKCEFCAKAYYTRGTLNIHRRIHLGEMVPCPICPKEFFRQVELDRHHIVAHSGASINADVKKQTKYYVYCKDCDKNMLTTSWKAHQAAHLKDPLLKCSICDKEFYSRYTCTYHMKKVHNYMTKEEYEPFITYCKTNRLSHLLLKQSDVIKPITT